MSSAIDMRLCETVKSFAAYVLALPRGLVRPQPWGPREVLAHIVYWHERYVEVVAAALAKGEPSPLSGTFRELNAKAVEVMAGESVEAMALRLIKAQRRLELIAPEARRRHVRVAIKPGATSRSLDDLLERVEGHIRGHHIALRRELRRAA